MNAPKVVYYRNTPTPEQLEIQEYAVKVANLCAKILREEFEVERVVMFGSMGQTPQFIRHHPKLSLQIDSDLDLAIFGGQPDEDFSRYLQALGACKDIANYLYYKYSIPYFEVDLVLASTMLPSMLKNINDGIEIGTELIIEREKKTTLADIERANRDRIRAEMNGE